MKDWLIFHIKYTFTVCVDFLVVMLLTAAWGIVVIAEWFEGRRR